MKTREAGRYEYREVRLGNVTVLTRENDTKIDKALSDKRKRGALRKAAGRIVAPLKLVE